MRAIRNHWREQQRADRGACTVALTPLGCTRRWGWGPPWGCIPRVDTHRGGVGQRCLPTHPSCNTQLLLSTADQTVWLREEQDRGVLVPPKFGIYGVEAGGQETR